MRIAYVGNFRPRHSTESHISATLEAMDHEVLRIQEDEIKEGTLLRDIASFSPDLFLWTRTWSGYVKIEDLKRISVPTVSYHLDLYIPISRLAKMKDDPFWKTDYVFTPDGDPGSTAVFKSMGINHHYLRPGVYKPECVDGRFNQDFSADIAFIGTTSGYHSEWPYRAKLIEFLKNTYGAWFKTWGKPGKSVRNEELNDVLASTKIIIGDSLCPHFTHQEYWSDRVYETTGRGGFMIHPRIKGLETEFKEHEEIAFYNYGDFDHLKELIGWYLEHDDYREAVRKAGMNRTKTEHTYHDRMKELLDVIR